jgi:micrococcal nuclease
MPVSIRGALAVALVALVASGGTLAATACDPRGNGSGDAAPVEAGEATVTRVVDGDTIVARLGDEDETIRLIGIDTPETKRPGTPVECFGPEASARMAELLPEGTVVRLERDVEERDRYGRLLAYVHRRTDDLFVNRAMAAEGFAGPSRVPPNVTRTDELAEAVADARAAGRGLWARCGGGHVTLPP